MKADRSSVERKIKIVKGQLDGIQKMIDEDRYCVDIAMQLLSSVSLLRKTAHEVLQAHIRSCVRDSLSSDDPAPKIEEAISVLEKMLDLK